MNLYQHYLEGDFEFGNAWIPAKHLNTHIEVIGSSGQGKTTLLEHLILQFLGRGKVGMLHIDPTGDGYRKLLGWKQEGKITNPLYIVDVDSYYPRYDPLSLARKDPTAFIPAIFSALSLINGAEADKARQMRRWVQNTLHGLMDNKKNLTEAKSWLLSESYKTARYHDSDVRLEWSKVTPSLLGPTLGWYDVFTNPVMKRLFSGSGFDWTPVYDEQAIVLVNLGAAKLGGDRNMRKAVAALFITGLIATAFIAKQKRKWLCVIDDATWYTPSHVGEILTEGRHWELQLVLGHHGKIPGLESEVTDWCLSKFDLKAIPKKFEKTMPELNEYECVHTFNNRYPQTFMVEPIESPKPDMEGFGFAKHEWYMTKKEEPLTTAGEPVQARTAPHSPPKLGTDKESQRPRAGKDRRGK